MLLLLFNNNLFKHCLKIVIVYIAFVDNGLLGMLADACHQRNLEDEIIQLRAQIEEKNTAIKNLTIESQKIILKNNDVIKHLSAENNQLRESIKQKDIQLQRKEDKARAMSVQMINDSSIKGIFNYYTGFPYARLQSIYKFLVPPGCKRPFIYKRAHIEIDAISLENQLLLTMKRLR